MQSVRPVLSVSLSIPIVRLGLGFSGVVTIVNYLGLGGFTGVTITMGGGVNGVTITVVNLGLGGFNGVTITMKGGGVHWCHYHCCQFGIGFH